MKIEVVPIFQLVTSYSSTHLNVAFLPATNGCRARLQELQLNQRFQCWIDYQGIIVSPFVARVAIRYAVSYTNGRKLTCVKQSINCYNVGINLEWHVWPIVEVALNSVPTDVCVEAEAPSLNFRVLSNRLTVGQIPTRLTRLPTDLDYQKH